MAAIVPRGHLASAGASLAGGGRQACSGTTRASGKAQKAPAGLLADASLHLISCIVFYRRPPGKTDDGRRFAPPPGQGDRPGRNPLRSGQARPAELMPPATRAMGSQGLRILANGGPPLGAIGRPRRSCFATDKVPCALSCSGDRRATRVSARRRSRHGQQHCQLRKPPAGICARGALGAAMARKCADSPAWGRG